MSFVSFIRPINLAAEREKFFASKTYNPIFQYDWSMPKIADLRRRKPYYGDLIDSIVKQDHALISREASLAFETSIDHSLLHAAKNVLRTFPELPPKGTTEELKREFQKATQRLKLTSYTLSLTKKLGFNFRPRYSRKTLEMGDSPNLQFFSIDGELKHELTHLVRSENGRYNSIEPSPNYLPTEEGLASFFQENSGSFGAAARFQHAAEYCASEISLSGSLRDTYSFFRDLQFERQLAWQRAIRHKFGFVDTREKGTIMKPAMYFYHAERIKQLEDFEKVTLLVGKIHQDELSKYPEYTGIIPLESLKAYFGLDLESAFPI